MKKVLFVVILLSLATLNACKDLRTQTDCLPNLYPTMQHIEANSYQVSNFRVTDSFEVVTQSYQQYYNPVSIHIGAKAGEWQKDKLDDSRILYECFSIINSFEVERGCIYVWQDEIETVIETVWYLSGDAGPTCDRDLSFVQ